jgi:hypothetical protein
MVETISHRRRPRGAPLMVALAATAAVVAPLHGMAADRPFEAFLGEWAGTGDIVG